MEKASHRNLEILAQLKDQLQGGRIVDVTFWWHPENGWGTPSLLVQKPDGDVVQIIVAADEQLSAQGFLLLQPTGETSH